MTRLRAAPWQRKPVGTDAIDREIFRLFYPDGLDTDVFRDWTGALAGR